MNLVATINGLRLLALMLPTPGSGREVSIGNHLITHYDPEIEALHNAIKILDSLPR